MANPASLTCAVVQLSSQDVVPENLERARALVAASAKAGAELVVLPENFAFMATDADKRAYAEDFGAPGPIVEFMRETARATGVFLIGGGFPEKSGDAARPHNTSVLYGPEGNVIATYRKIHLFDVDVPGGRSYRESEATTPGSLDRDASFVVAEVKSVKVGLTICYDLRFPELYRKLAAAGARVLTVPAAFTLQTGKDHWTPLLRARAIENQSFVLAAAQSGTHPQGRATYGKSLIVDPWGDVIAQASDGPGYALARLDFDYQDRVREAMPCASHRRL